jgi:hypothetical protein
VINNVTKLRNEEKKMTEFLFNDEIVNKNVDNLINVGIEAVVITKKQIAEVKRILMLDGNSKEELQAKRNSVVKIIGGISNEYRLKNDYDSMDKCDNCMSGVVAVIDQLYFSR